MEESARENLRHALWRLRKALQSVSAAGCLQANDLTIAFNTSATYWLDAAALEGLDERASTDELISVLAAYQGELLPGFYEEWIVLEREHLYSIFEHHMARLMSLLQNEKRWLDILDWGERWIKLGQKPEPAYRALMSAHAAKGDMSKVAMTYERCIKSLKEFGVEPSEQTRALYEELREKKTIFQAESVRLTKEKREELPKTNLPTPLTSFIGREREIEEVKYLLSSARLLTLTGAGGIGKTRLAIQAAHELIRSFKDGIWWVELAPLTEQALVPPALAQALSVRESPGQSLTESIKNFLREKQALLILDNCEHLVVPCTQLADDLLRQCANLRIMTTSREILGITGEAILQVPVLSSPVRGSLSSMQAWNEFESIQLFIERAEAAHPDLRLTQQSAFAVTQICQRLDGIPLAIELAAARVKFLSLEEIAKRLDDRFTLLTQGSRSALPRHQTLRALMDWSHELLSEPERVLWRRLSVFSGGWTLEAAEAVCTDSSLQHSRVFELLSSLVDKSLVIAEDRNGVTRYSMLEMIRQYGERNLQSSGEDRVIHAFHLRFFVEMAEQCDREIHGPHQLSVMDQVEREHANFRAALNWSISHQQTEIALRLLGALGWAWDVSGHYSEATSWFRMIQSLPEIARHSNLYARLLNEMGRHVWRLGNMDEAKSFFEEGRMIWQELKEDGEQGLAKALDWLGIIALFGEEDFGKGQTLIEQSIKLYQKCEDQRGIAESLFHLGLAKSAQRDNVSALSLYERSLTMFHELGDLWSIDIVSQYSGQLYLSEGHYEKARVFFEQHLRNNETLQFVEGTVRALQNLGHLYKNQGEYDQAEQFYIRCLTICREHGRKSDTADVLYSLGLLALHKNDYVLAMRHFTDYFDLARTKSEKMSAREFLTALAAIAGGTNQPERAARLSGAAQAAMYTDYIFAPLVREELERHIGIAREQLGEPVFKALQEEGRAMTLQQAIRFARKEIE